MTGYELIKWLKDKRLELGVKGTLVASKVHRTKGVVYALEKKGKDIGLNLISGYAQACSLPLSLYIVDKEDKFEILKENEDYDYRVVKERFKKVRHTLSSNRNEFCKKNHNLYNKIGEFEFRIKTNMVNDMVLYTILLGMDLILKFGQDEIKLKYMGGNYEMVIR